MHSKIPPHFDLEPREAVEASPQFASTLANGFDVLRCFSIGEPLLGNKEIAEALNLTKPTVSRLTYTLVGLGYLRRDERTGKYTLGPALLSLGYPLLVHLTLRQLAAREMGELAREMHATVSLAVRDRLQAVYVETVQDGNWNGTRPDVGSTRPLLRTATGRSLLYAQMPAERAMLCERLTLEYPEDWARYGSALDQAFADIDRQGFCVVTRDWQPDLCGIGAPLRYRWNNLPLAMNITIPATAMDDDYVTGTLGPRLYALVKSLDYRMGIV